MVPNSHACYFILAFWYLAAVFGVFLLVGPTRNFVLMMEFFYFIIVNSCKIYRSEFIWRLLKLLKLFISFIKGSNMLKFLKHIYVILVWSHNFSLWNGRKYFRRTCFLQPYLWWFGLSDISFTVWSTTTSHIRISFLYLIFYN